MKRAGTWIILLLVLAGLGSAVLAAPYIYKWVKDKTVNSDRILPSAQKMRVVPISEGQALDVVRRVMAEDLFLALAEYHKTKHIQDAETTADSVLPEEVIGQKQMEADLVDEDYRFFLEVKLRAYGNRTRITAKASPMYRIRDVEAEEQAYGDSGTSQTSVDVKVNAGYGSGVAMGPIFVMPFDGLPLEYQIQPLPDAAERGAQIVRSFMYLLDKRVAAGKQPSAPGESPAGVTTGQPE